MKKFDIVLVDLNPVKGSEQSGIRPCIIIQNNAANQFARTFVVAIISSVIKDYPHTVIIDPDTENNLDVKSRIDLLQVRTVDQSRILKKIGKCFSQDQIRVDEAIKVAFQV